MCAFHQLPSDLFYEIALHLPLPKDVLAFTHTNSRIHRELLTPGLFKARLALRGWDISAWKDEDESDDAQLPGDLERWMSIDYIYCRSIQLFDEAAVDHGHFLITTDTPTDKAVLWGSERPTGAPEQDNRIPSNSCCRVFDGDRMANWLNELREVLPLFVTHHRGGNISQITDAKYRDSLRAYARVVDDLGVLIRLGDPDHAAVWVGLPRVPSHYGWLEHMSFSLMAILMQCDATTIVSIFTDSNIELTPTALGSALDQPISVSLDCPMMQISEGYSGIFLFQAAFCITLHLDATGPGMPESGRPPLLAPMLPHFEPRGPTSESYYSYFGHLMPVEPRTFTTTTPVRTTTPSTCPPSRRSAFSTIYGRPWLCDGRAGTPLASLSSTTGRAWAGYYTYFGRGRRDPMYLELRASPPPPGSDSDTDPGRMSYFSGEGHDSIGPFTISGSYDSCMGVVRAIKAYGVHKWEWRGMLTPFGMAGLWGPSPGWDGGWWWIWPREWSPTTTR